jgi:pimeloyl-ACP methyl ester carboxylesterase
VHSESRKDRSAPYGGGREWALWWPEARLLTIEDGGHAPWIESPDVSNDVAEFLEGRWPARCEQVTSL